MIRTMTPAPNSAPARTRRWRWLAVATVVSATVGVVAGILASRSGWIPVAGLRRLSPWQLGVVCTAYPAAFVLALLVHELGHLVAGALAGYRPFLLIVGPVRFERSATRWRGMWNRDLSLFGGLAGATPLGLLESAQLRRRLAVLVAGGPLASLALGGAAWWAVPSAFAAGSDASTAWLFVSALGRTFALCSLLIGAVALVPGRTSGFLTDGARLARLARGGPPAERDAALQGIYGASMAGIRPRDWPAGHLERAHAVEDGSLFDTAACQLAQVRAADAGDGAEARRLLEIVLEHIERLPQLAQPAVRYDAARQLALWGDVERARRLVASGGTAVGSPALQPLAELALLVADRDHAEAAVRVPAVRQAIAETLDRGLAIWFGDELDAMVRATGSGLEESSTET